MRFLSRANIEYYSIGESFKEQTKDNKGFLVLLTSTNLKEFDDDDLFALKHFLMLQLQALKMLCLYVCLRIAGRRNVHKRLRYKIYKSTCLLHQVFQKTKEAAVILVVLLVLNRLM